MMSKKTILLYTGMFLAFFLCGLLIAFAWQRFISKKTEAPLASAPTTTLAAAASIAHGPTATHASAPSTTAAATSSLTPPSPPSVATGSVSTSSTGAISSHTISTALVSTASSTEHTPPTIATTPAFTASSGTTALHAAPPAVTTKPSQSAAPAPGPGEAHDIILLIDSSGSMKKTDPRSYRKEAAKLFISLLSKNDRVGIMSFGDAPTVLMPLTVNSSQNRAALISAVNGVSSKELTTDITAAVRAGFDQIKASSGRKKVLVMLSDGKIDLGSGAKDQASFTALQRLLPDLPKTDIKLFTVAFTDESDSVLLEDMARKTGGFFRFAKADKDVHVIFTTIFEKLKSPDTIPLEGDSFTIDAEVREATVIITRRDKAALTLLDPSKAKHTAVHHAANIAWFASPAFDMVTIQEPAPGFWSVKLNKNEGNKIYVLTNLSLKTSFDKNFVDRGKNVAIHAWLEKLGGMVIERDVLDTTVFTAAIAGPEGKTAMIELASSVVGTDRRPTGTYSASIPIAAAGEYTVTLTALGKTFKRGKTLSFKAVEPVQAPIQEHKPAPLTSPPPPSHEDGMSWTRTLIRFGIINLLVGVFGAGGYLLWKKRSGKGGPR